MENKYVSTRGFDNNYTSSEAILNGIAKDGGLFINKDFDTIKINLSDLKNKKYEQIAKVILSKFLTDYDEIELETIIKNAYTNTFYKKEITPLVKLNQNFHILELFHGPTSAFKDIALTLLPHLMNTALKKNNFDQEILILTATSGDTGKAALESFKNIPGIKIIVFYPNNGVSDVQKKQMITQEGNNIFVAGIDGNFDDAQNAVKSIFNDFELNSTFLNKKIKLSSANSINIGRLIPQVVYYFYAYMQLVEKKEIRLGEEINFSVPTGNFGNILAAYYAKNLGLPINKLICASNQNNVLYDFFKTGIYNKNRTFLKTISPSMDILISSNLERLLYHLSENNSSYISELMNSLNSTGIYSVQESIKSKINKIFFESYATDLETTTNIKNVYEKYNYLLDPHTSVAYIGTKKLNDKNRKTIILSTASPYKFTKDVYESIFEKTEKNEFEIMNLLYEKTQIEIPENLKNLENKDIYHQNIINKNNIKQYIEEMML